MAFTLKVTTPFPGKGKGVYIAGPYVTPQVHDAISTLMTANHLSDPFYKARTDVGAFFQGGCDKRDGEYIFLELWLTRDPVKVAEFEKQLNKAVRGRIPESLTEIRIAPNTEGAYYLFLEIAKETGCRHWGGDAFTPLYFYPEDNEQWWKVYNLCKYMELNIGFPQFHK